MVPNAISGEELTAAVESARSFGGFGAAAKVRWIRRDEVGWVDDCTVESGLHGARELIRGVSGVLEEHEGYSRSKCHQVPVECQLGRYAKDGFYRLHRDNRVDHG